MWGAVAILAIAIVAAGIVGRFEMRSRRQRRNQLLQRDAPSFDEWVRRYGDPSFTYAAETALPFLELCAEVYEVTPTHLRPQDNFTEELCPEFCFSEEDSFQQIQEMIQRQYGVPWDVKWTTIQEMIEGVISAKIK